MFLPVSPSTAHPHYHISLNDLSTVTRSPNPGAVGGGGNGGDGGDGSESSDGRAAEGDGGNSGTGNLTHNLI